jgi:hypothetical protein
MTRWLYLAILLTAANTTAYAQGSYTVEEMAAVRDFEMVRFVPSSVTEKGGLRLFNILIRYADPDEVPPGGVASRKVSYRARCESGELAISVIILRNINAQTLKVITVPPGGEEFFRPDSSSRPQLRSNVDRARSRSRMRLTSTLDIALRPFLNAHDHGLTL